MHGHSHCDHELAYCGHCDVAYCRKCQREWGPRKYYWPWAGYYQYQYPYTIYQGGGNLSVQAQGSQTTAASISNVPLESHNHGG